MVKRNGETVEYQVTLNIPHLRKKINKTCANRPVSCVNGEKTSDFGADKETVYHCAEALGRRACPLRHRLRDATSPKGRGFQGGLLLFCTRHGILEKEKPADPAGKRRMVS
jgi:hypothetical protein